jgi:competence ComEA-like helix-hairpin-helix protein
MGQDAKRVDINSADAATLQTIEGVDGPRARLIIEYRKSQGPFESWEQLEQIDGIGPALAEKLRAQGKLGSAAGTGDHRLLPDLDDGEIVEALTGLAELDAGAAASYAAAAAATLDDQIARQLSSFEGDHHRHVRDLNALIKKAGGEPVEEEVTGSDSLLSRLTDSAAALGASGLIVAMIANEMLTNGSYQTALELPFGPEIRTVLERNRADEERHLHWLLEVRGRLGIDFPHELARA